MNLLICNAILTGFMGIMWSKSTFTNGSIKVALLALTFANLYAIWH